MATKTPPYLQSYGYIAKTLDKVKSAQTPPRFTQDYLATTLGLKGGNARAIIPFLKRTGFLGGDGVPTDRYKRFRNSSQEGQAAAEALRQGYDSLYQINEYVHDASDDDLMGLIVQITGFEKDSKTAKAIAASFKALREYANFDNIDENEYSGEDYSASSHENETTRDTHVPLSKTLGLSYTINLNLPSTSDIKVFDAIFKSLKEHLLI